MNTEIKEQDLVFTRFDIGRSYVRLHGVINIYNDKDGKEKFIIARHGNPLTREDILPITMFKKVSHYFGKPEHKVEFFYLVRYKGDFYYTEIKYTNQWFERLIKIPLENLKIGTIQPTIYMKRLIEGSKDTCKDASLEKLNGKMSYFYYDFV